MQEYVLAVDIGTSSCKAGLLDPQGQVAAQRSAPYPTAFPAPGLAEQDPEHWWQAAADALRSLVAAAAVRPEQVRAIALSGQTPTLALLDAAGAPLGPGLTWQDGRGGAEVQWLREQVAPETLAQWLGAHIPVGASWPPVRLLWFRRHRPDLLARAALAVQPKDLVYRRLTGVWATDRATWRGLVNLQTGRIDPRLLDLLQVGAGLVPPALAPTDAPGRLTPAAAAALGLAAGTPVAVGWPDSWCAILGAGGGRFARGFDVSGTSEVVGVFSQGPVAYTPGLMSLPMLPELNAFYGPTQAGGGALDWALSLWDSGGAPAERYARALAAAAAVPAGSDGLLFLPYLQGERAPHWDPHARGVFFGLTTRHTQAHLVRAVLEGVAFSIRQVLLLGARAAQVELDAVMITGGPSRLDLWNQIKADVAGAPFLQTRAADSGLVGGGVLGAVAAGWHPDPAAAVAAMVQVERRVEPDPAHRERYTYLYGIYADLYGSLQGLYGRLANRPGGG